MQYEHADDEQVKPDDEEPVNQLDAVGNGGQEEEEREEEGEGGESGGGREGGGGGDMF